MSAHLLELLKAERHGPVTVIRRDDDEVMQ